jgi:hypothetical protein
MENKRQKIAEIITHTHKTPLEQADEILLLFSVSGSSSPDDFWKQEYDEAVKEIGNLQDQLKDAESAIRDMESELRSRY